MHSYALAPSGVRESGLHVGQASGRLRSIQPMWVRTGESYTSRLRDRRRVHLDGRHADITHRFRLRPHGRKLRADVQRSGLARAPRRDDVLAPSGQAGEPGWLLPTSQTWSSAAPRGLVSLPRLARPAPPTTWLLGGMLMGEEVMASFDERGAPRPSGPISSTRVTTTCLSPA